ncbi:MAG: translation initiation factor IF-2 [Alphaproteobacteria bacterium]|nr:translation initiation factor IF-2 [Alphaproteobacteria bacterium]
MTEETTRNTEILGNNSGSAGDDQKASHKTLTLSKKLELKKVVEKDQVRQSFSHGRSKTVEVEVKRKRPSLLDKAGPDKPALDKPAPDHHIAEKELVFQAPPQQVTPQTPAETTAPQARRLTGGEFEARLKAVQQAMKHEAAEAIQKHHHDVVLEEHHAEAELPVIVENIQAETIPELVPVVVQPSATPPVKAAAPKWSPPVREAPRERQAPIILRATEYGPSKQQPRPEQPKVAVAQPSAPRHHPSGDAPSSYTKEDTKHPVKPIAGKAFVGGNDTEEESAKRKSYTHRPDAKKVVAPVRRTTEAPKKLHRNVITKVLDGNLDERTRSVAALKRARQKHKQSHAQAETVKIIREVIIPESISVGELANRMAVRGAEIVKTLMKQGLMVTINQIIDGDTAELICGEFGHKCRRVSDSDIEIGLGGGEDTHAEMISRPPVVTVMGHVDHGKTSLLDALRETDVVSGEAGGITQHIGAYQVTIKSGHKITFIDTPGHAAFSEMRARGANATDVVVLVVAADDGIKEQTLEAINHAKAAKVPMVVAINKIDKPGANPDRVRQELLQHGIVLEEFGGDVIAVEVSAKQRTNLDKLEEAILLQSEILDLKSNPTRTASGVVIEAKIDKGRGTVATVLIQRGTLNVGDIFVAGTESGKVKVLVNDHGKKIDSAPPSMPIEVLGFGGVPEAGDEFFVVENETKAKEITDYRRHRRREQLAALSSRGTMENMMSKIAAGETKELALVIKTDVQGSLEAITSSLAKLGTNEVSARILHGAVGGINESDVTLAKASEGIIIGFNVRANPQARELAKREGLDIRYYSIIYNVIDDIKAIMSGLLAPTLREIFLGTAEIRTVFNITKVGKVAGCFITDGTVKRGAKVRLLRDNVVIHEGELKTLKRFKDEVKEVKESYECGMAFENYSDIRVGDTIECFEIESIARQL